MPVDVVDLHLEALRQHLIRLVQHQHLHVPRLEVPTADHVEAPSGRRGHDLHAVVEPPDVLGHRLAADHAVARDLHPVAQLHRHVLRLLGKLTRGRQHQALRGRALRVDELQATKAEHARLAGSTLALRDKVAAADERHKRPLLDGGRLLVAVRHNAALEVLVQTHLLEGGDDLDGRRLVRELNLFVLVMVKHCGHDPARVCGVSGGVG